MMSRVLAVVRSIGAVVAGFAVITAGTIFTFLVLVEDFGYRTSGPADLALGTLGALASGVGGGLVAAWVAARRPLAHAAGLAVPIALDTASIVAKAGPGADPLWFDLGGSAILLAGGLAGGWLVARKRAARPARGAA